MPLTDWDLLFFLSNVLLLAMASVQREVRARETRRMRMLIEHGASVEHQLCTCGLSVFDCMSRHCPKD